MIKERIGTELGLWGGRVKKGFLNRKESLSQVRADVADKTRRAARKTDYYVHDNAWRMIAVSAGLAFVAGYLLNRRQSPGGYETRVEDAGLEPTQSRANRWEFVHSALPLALFVFKAVRSSRCDRNA